MHDRLYERPDELSDAELVDHADELGLDTDRFAADLKEGAYEARINEDVKSGAESGVEEPPALFVDGERYEGDYTADALTAALIEAGDVTGVSPVDALTGTDGTDVGTDSDALRETLDRSERGAPAAGEAVRDRFSADEIFQRIVATADEEFNRSKRLLFLSGIAAGLAMSISLVGTAGLTALVPQTDGAALAIGYLLYPLGFAFVILGSYQLFTENTLTPVTLVLTRVASVPALLRIWGVVFTANILGGALMAYVLANTGIFTAEAATVAHDLGAHLLHLSWADTFWKGVFAGGIVAGMVWLVHAARDTTARVLVIFALGYTVGAAQLAHCIIGAIEVLYVVFSGDATILAFLWGFLVPATLGNTLGGVVLVALLNYSHTSEHRVPNRDREVPQLEWSEWLFGDHIGQPTAPTLDTGESERTSSD